MKGFASGQAPGRAAPNVEGPGPAPGHHAPWVVSSLCAAVTIGLYAAAALHAVVIPAPYRIAAQITATLAAPVDNEMDKPTDVAVDSVGRVYIADGVKSRVVVLGADRSFAGAISAVGGIALARPVGLCVDDQDRVWIADPGLHRALAAATKGEDWPGRAPLLADLELPSVRRGETSEPASPTDVAVSFDGKQVYVVDDAHHRLIARDTRTRATQVIGGLGRGLGDFEFPFSIALGPNGYIFVCEAIGARVQRITPAGRPSGQIGRWGVEIGQFYRPKGIAVSPGGLVYVGDSSLGAVQVFRTDGTFLGVLTDPQGQPLHLQHPMGMALNPQGQLLVVELTANRVAIVTMSGLPAVAPSPASQPVEEGAAP